MDMNVLILMSSFLFFLRKTRWEGERIGRANSSTTTEKKKLYCIFQAGERS
jgi:hypothetical protein